MARPGKSPIPRVETSPLIAAAAPPCRGFRPRNRTVAVPIRHATGFGQIANRPYRRKTAGRSVRFRSIHWPSAFPPHKASRRLHRHSVQALLIPAHATPPQSHVTRSREHIEDKAERDAGPVEHSGQTDTGAGPSSLADTERAQGNSNCSSARLTRLSRTCTG